MACTRLLHGYFYRSQGSWYAYSELESMPESVSTHALSQVSLAAATGPGCVLLYTLVLK